MKKEEEEREEKNCTHICGLKYAADKFSHELK